MTDVLIGIFLLYESILFVRTKNKLGSIRADLSRMRINFSSLFFWSIFFLSIGLNMYFSVSIPNTLFGYLKLFEFLLFGYFLYKYFLHHTRSLVFSFLLGCSLQAVLGIAQFFHNGSLGGMLYYIGERSYTSVTPGIANASLDGLLVLRPYGTLPHPNVLGGVLLIGILFLVSFRKYFTLPVFLFLLTLFSTSLLFTLSRTAIILGSVILPFLFLSKIVSIRTIKLYIVYGIAVLLIIVLSPLGQRFHFLLGDESITMRIYLLNEAYHLFMTHMLFGVGLHAFLPALSQTETFSQDIRFLQPVHSIYALLITEIGIIGVLVVGWKGVSLFLKKHLEFPALTIALLVSILCIGLFDHYFLTLQQGQLLLTFCLSYILAQYKQTK